MLQFLRFQKLALTKTIWNKPRIELAKLVVAGAEKGRKAALRVIRDERKWIQGRAMSFRKSQAKLSILSRLEDEGTQLAIREFITRTGDAVSSQLLALAITQYWLDGTLPQPEVSPIETSSVLPMAQTSQLPPPSSEVMEKVLTSRTAARWLRRLGYKYKEVKKGIYKDGHEREDVVTYRQQEFLPILEDLKPFMVTWELDAEGKPQMIYPQDLPLGQRPIVLVTHDESTFDSNDGRRYVWMKEGEPPLRKKTRGKGIMVSEFVTAGGRLKAPEWLPIENLPNFGLTEDNKLRYSAHLATMRIEYGGDNWWDGDDLVLQVTRVAIPIFEAAFPGCQALFMFDNATSHSAFADNALRARNMGLRPGGAQGLLRPGFNQHTEQVQSMIMEDERAKGLKRVLEERGLWRTGLRLQCKKPGTDKRLKTCLLGGQCCARALMANEADFRNQKCRLQEEVEHYSHQVLFYPKFHCELNFIEYMWGAAKKYTRNHCGYSIKTLRYLIPEALHSIEPGLIWKFSQKAERIMEAYCQGIAYGSPEFQMSLKHKYKSHRRVSNLIEVA